MTRVVLVPGALALVPAYASLDDPVARLRAACAEATAWLGPVCRVLASPQGARVAASLLDRTPPEAGGGRGVLVVANGSATRTEKAPGHLDDRAVPFDDALGRALQAGDTGFLGALDLALAGALWADVRPLVELATTTPSMRGLGPAEVRYADAPFGVQYWVMSWEVPDDAG